MWCRKRTPAFEAVQVTADNAADVAHWAGGIFHWDADPSQPEVRRIGPGLHTARVGDFVMRTPEGVFIAVEESAFMATYTTTAELD